MKILLILLLAWIAVTVVAVIMASTKMKHIDNYRELYRDMDESEMILLMGKDFKKEEFDKYTRYEWSMSARISNRVNKVVVDVQNSKIKNIKTYKN